MKIAFLTLIIFTTLPFVFVILIGVLLSLAIGVVLTAAFNALFELYFLLRRVLN